MKREITPKTSVGDVLAWDGETAKIFVDMGLHCLGCPAARQESLEEACALHGIDPGALIEKLNAHFADR